MLLILGCLALLLLIVLLLLRRARTNTTYKKQPPCLGKMYPGDAVKLYNGNKGMIEERILREDLTAEELRSFKIPEGNIITVVTEIQKNGAIKRGYYSPLTPAKKLQGEKARAVEDFMMRHSTKGDDNY